MSARDLRDGRYWGTEDEIAFIRTRAESGCMMVGRFLTGKEMLKGYLAGARLRTDWDRLDRDRIIRMAEILLAEKERAA